MKIIVAGQGPFGEKVLEGLLRKGEKIQGVFCPRGRPGEAIKTLAADSKISVFQPKRMKDPEVREAYLTLAPDLVVLAFVTDILPKDLLDIPGQGTICYHPSLLPKHRGASSINWAIIQGETKTGLTILWADAGIDTGPILLQREVVIEPEETTGSLYFNKLFPQGVEAVAEAVEMVKKGRAPKIPQDESLATYEPPCDDRVAGIDWAKPSRKIFNLIRGCDPQPGAHTTLRGQKVRLYQPAAFQTAEPGISGEILSVREKALTVCLGEAVCVIKKVRGEDGKKLDGQEFAEQVGLQKGMCFGS
ncbi:MAG: methionyl-tRNA formyltransferase [Desulfohalobiaceae bacterium]|nr:methionyl-tRNA formyltransferase [Desulfohalobiaceae bacterium]